MWFRGEKADTMYLLQKGHVNTPEAQNKGRMSQIQHGGKNREARKE